MKKIVLASVVVLIFSCTNKSGVQEPEASIQGKDSISVLDDRHNAENSLDYMGTYKGVLPTASGSGMEVEIVLSEGLYTKKVKYIEQGGDPSVTQGRYIWNQAGNTITLLNEDQPNQYFVGENNLRQLDINGNRITGEIEDDYILNKL